MDVVPRNILERIYSIIVLLFAMVAFSSIVGTVTSSMTIIRSMKNDRQKQFWLLRRFLKQKNVSMDLTVRMTRFLDHQQVKQQKLIQVGKVVFLQQLSDQLARELAFEMFEPLLHQHPFFRFLSHEMKAVAARICQMALKLMQVATDDTVFNVGEEANKAFVIKSGDFVYTHISEGILEPAPKEKEWLAEVAIWTRWRYRGKLAALRPGELLQVEAARYAEAMSIHPKPVALGRVYGHKLVTLVNCQPPSLRTDVLRDDEFYNSAVFTVGKRASAMDAKFDVWDEENDEDGEEEEDKTAAEHLNGTDADEDAASEGGKAKRRAKEEDAQSPRTWTRSPFASSPWGMLCSRRFFAGVCFHPCTSEQVHVQQAGPRSGSASLW
uniref:Cyclic nucleotide-binding domain-containing protein n=1 Tax=Alexandrium catenella TaxID=2925 RepID=A0A7S1RR69_ALECA|mmetsp:Transcript_68823/g.183049  ORF Transcript_68823/g.183049 Transcript_68823/m.183049 type:complete len:381 (+) Transcript_68823:2-1144(+)